MRLILFRHGPAGERDASRWPDDALRPLSERGVERTQAAAHGLRRLEPEIRRIVTSPLARARQSAEILAEALDGAKLMTLEALNPGRPYREVIEFVSKLHGDGATVLVGHEPDLGKLAGILLFGAPAALPLRKAGACAFDFEDRPAAGQGRLAWFLAPRMLRRLAHKEHRV